jgi:hypothetical protein
LTVGVGDVALATEEAVDEFKVRVSRRSQLQIDELVNKGYLPVVGALAGAAQGTGGWFSADDLPAAQADGAAISDSRAFAERLAASQLLLEAGDDGSGRGFRFTEPTVPIYLWLLAAKGHALDHERPALEPATA